MYQIRPYQFFSLIDAAPAERIASVPLPHRRQLGGLTLLETFLIIAAARVVRAERVFEFGTFLGSTTFVLALNTAWNAKILTLDLDQRELDHAVQHPADAALTQLHMASESLDFLGTSVSQKIETLSGNSKTFDFAPWERSIDLVFIDGGHDLDTVKSDTENGFEMVSRDKPSCILWHDYRNPECSDLTQYLERLSDRLKMFHIGDTMLCAWFNDPSAHIVSHLLL